MTTYFREWGNQYRSYNQNIKLAIYANIFTQIGMGMFMTLYNFYIKELGYSEITNGNIIAMTSLATTIFLVPAGFISDFIGRKKVLAYGAFLSGILLLCRSLFEIEATLLILAFGSGLSMAFLQVSIVPWLAENSTEKQRVHLFSFHFAIMMGANVVGNLFSGFLSDFLVYYMYMSPIAALRFTLSIGAIIFLFGLIPIVLMKEAARNEQKKFLDLSILKGKSSAWRLVMLFAGAQLVIGIGAGLVIPYLNLYFQDRFHTSHTGIGIILSLGQAATAVAMVIGPAVVRKVGEVKAIVLLQLLSLPFLLVTAFTTNLYLAALAFLFRQALMNAGNPIITSFMMGKVHNDIKGVANSFNQMAFSFGWATMGPISTYIVATNGAYWGYSIVFSITACLYFCGAIYFYLVFRDKKPIIANSTAV